MSLHGTSHPGYGAGLRRATRGGSIPAGRSVGRRRRVVLPLLVVVVRVRVIRMACSAWGESDPARGVQGDGFDGAGFPAAVTVVAGLVPDRDLRPGQRLELREQGRLVALDRDQQVGTPRGDLGRVGGLGMQRVGSEDRVLQAAQDLFDGVQQRREGGDVVGLRRDGDLREDDAGAGVQRGQQVYLAAVDAAGTPQGLAVDGDDLPVPRSRGTVRQSGPGA